MTGDIVLFVVGLTLLTLGADWLVTGSSRIAENLGMSPLLIGLTVVAFGTSAPELVVSGTASLRGQPGLAVGNVMGSTVANVGLIVGLGAVIRPIDVHRRLLARESPLLILVLSIVMLLSLNHALGRLDGLALVLGFLVYIGYLFRWERRRGPSKRAPRGVSAGDGGDGDGDDAPIPWLNWLRTVVGLAGLLLGADWLVDAAVAIARAFDVSDAVIGATMVAVGTSLPELASTAAASARGLGDIAIGNVIGSNVFNLGLVLGTAALLSPLYLPPQGVVRHVLPALIFCVLLIPLAYTGRRVNRWEGALLLAGYASFIVWVI